MTDMQSCSKLANDLARALEGLRADDLSTVQAFAPLFADRMIFEDPIQQVEGRDAFMEMNYRLMRRVKSLSFRVERVAVNDSTIVLEWFMRAKPKFGPSVQVKGVTRAMAAQSNGTLQIVDHRDYWDIASLFASAFPFGTSALKLLLKPIA